MKRKLFILMFAACSLLSCTDGIWDAIHGLEDKYSDLDARVAYLEELCSEMNTNISALQTIVSVILTNDYIISIAPITKDGQEIGYVITFAIHEPITIYHGHDGQDGEDGKDGAEGKDGADGKDGTTPIIGVALDPNDNAYYWTLNGKWLLDENGNRIPLTSRDGQDGEDGTDGEDGKDGADGQDGKDGVTPQLKIEDGYWYVSTDNGATWTQLGKATGEDGQNGKDGVDGADGKDGQDGADGKDGQDGAKGEKGDPGDTMFQSVTQDDDFVYFTLADGIVLIVPRGYKEEKVQIIDGVIMAEFSVSETKKVYFSMGNLQYSTEGTHKCADGTTQPGTWNFAEKQWEEGTLLYWGNSGYNDTIKQVYSNDWWEEEKRATKYFKAYETIAQSDISNTYNDWGVYNAIENGGNTPNKFRTLTRDEWIYLWEQRPHADKLRGTTKVDGIDCTYLLPDNWENLEANIPSAFYSGKQIYDVFPSVNTLLDKGVVFFRKNPKKINLSSFSSNPVNSGEGYWSSTHTDKLDLNGERLVYCAYAILGNTPDKQETYFNYSSQGVSPLHLGCLPVRLVKDVE